MQVEDKRLIEMARFIARFAGVENEDVDQMARCRCEISKSTSTKVFQTPAMLIVAGVDTLELSITKRENDNPVVVADAQGKVFRFHGEIAHISDELHSVFAMTTSQR